MSKPKIDQEIDIPGELIKDLLTDSEWRMVKQRFLVIQLLNKGGTVRGIATKAQVGTDTVMRIARQLELNPKLRNFFKDTKNISTSKWVFGQISLEK